MSERENVTVEEGKYTFRQPDKDYRIHIDRYGEGWVLLEEGSNAISALLYEHREALAKLKETAKPQDVDLDYVEDMIEQMFSEEPNVTEKSINRMTYLLDRAVTELRKRASMLGGGGRLMKLEKRVSVLEREAEVASLLERERQEKT